MEWFKKIWDMASTPLFELSGNSFSIISILAAVGVLIASIHFSKLAEKFIANVLKDKGIDQGVKGSIQRITRYGVVVVGALITLDTMGISIKSLAALGAVLGVGIGFGLQNITQNFISGLIILFERPIKTGDLVTLGSISGKVVDIRARYTIIHTRDDIAIIVPNSKFISEEVINHSFSGTMKRMHLKVGVAYGSDVQRVRDILIEIANAHNKVATSPAPNVFFEDFGDSSLNFNLLVWISDQWIEDFILSDLRFSIDKKFREDSIVIPFPQRDLHFNSSNISFKS